MGWGIDFNADIYLSKQDYNGNINQVNDKLEEINKDLEMIKSKILMFSTSNINDIIPEEWNDSPIDWVYNQINDLLEYYDEISFQKYQLDLYAEYLTKLKKD